MPKPNATVESAFECQTRIPPPKSASPRIAKTRNDPQDYARQRVRPALRGMLSNTDSAPLPSPSSASPGAQAATRAAVVRMNERPAADFQRLSSPRRHFTSPHREVNEVHRPHTRLPRPVRARIPPNEPNGLPPELPEAIRKHFHSIERSHGPCTTNPPRQLFPAFVDFQLPRFRRKFRASPPTPALPSAPPLPNRPAWCRSA